MNNENKIKKAFISLGVAIVTLTTKAFGVATFYGIPEPEPMYGVVRPESEILGFIAKVGAIVLIPIVAIVGLIVYLRKKKK